MDPYDLFDWTCFGGVVLIVAGLLVFAGIRIGIPIGRGQRRTPSTRIRTVPAADPLGTLLAHRIRLGQR